MRTRKNRSELYKQLAEKHITGNPDIDTLCRAFCGYLTSTYKDGQEIPEPDMVSLMSMMVNIAGTLGPELTAWAFARKAELDFVDAVQDVIEARESGKVN